MKSKRKIILLLITALLLSVLLSACGNRNKNITKEQPLTDTHAVGTEANDSLEVKTYTPKAMPIEMFVPEAAAIRETDLDVYAETNEYLLHVFEKNTCDGGIINSDSEVLTLLNSTDKSKTANNMLDLSDFSIPDDAEVQLFEEYNGMTGFLCPMSQMRFESEDGKISSGDGFVMVYGKKDGLGIYVALGILKNANVGNLTDRGKKVWDMLEKCALSVKKMPDTEDEFVKWQGPITNDINASLVYKKNAIKDIKKSENGVCLFYDEAKVGCFIVQYYQAREGVSSETFLQSIVDRYGKDGVTFSNMEEVRGKMTYKKVSLSYSRDGKEICEIICVAANEKGGMWMIDLYGSPQDVKEQEENLAVLLWSFQETE